MGFVDEFREEMDEVVTWRQVTGRDDYGKPTYSAGQEFNARIVRKHKLVRDRNGDEVVATAQIWLLGSPAVDPDDQLELPDGSTPAIAAVERYPDEEGDAFTKVMLR